MKRVLNCLFLIVGLGMAAPTFCAAPVEGRDFVRIVPVVPTQDPTKIVVTEFFSYQCPHCFDFAAPFKEWSARKRDGVVVVREAVSIGHAAWEPSARAFYALQSLNKLDANDAALFTAVHEQHVPLLSDEAILEWVSKRGIDRATFQAAYKGFDVDRKMKNSTQVAVAHKLPSVPTVSIDGRYLVAIVGNVDFRIQLQTVDALIEKVRAEKRK